MSGKPRTQITLFDKTYDIASREEDVEELLDAAKILEERLWDLHGHGNRKPPDIERLAVTACLNLIHDLNRLDPVVTELTDLVTDTLQRLETPGALALKR